jgi:tyrosyl-tRNA synthetase
MQFKSPFLQELQDRGFIYQGTDLESLDALTIKESITLYIGYDATAASLHVGNLMTIMLMRIAQRHGHKPIVLMGGATTKVADPSGKDKTRPPLDETKIQQNIETIRGVFEKYLDFKAGKNVATMVDNNDWLADLKYMDFLAEYGAMFSINRMLTFESIKQRLEREQSLSFLEFNYMVLQGYDFLELYKKHNCVLQMGGSDQWGNILNGVELIHKALGKKSYGLTCPLITTASGAKMGKSSAGAVWLNGDNLAPSEFFTYWRSVEDPDVVRFMKLYTDIPVNEINELANNLDINALKERLAFEVTKLAHGEEAAKGAELNNSDSIEDIKNTEDREDGANLKTAIENIDINLNEELPEEFLRELYRHVRASSKSLNMNLSLPLGALRPTETLLFLNLHIVPSNLTLSDFEKGVPAFKILAEAGLVESGGEGRRLIEQKGVKFNNQLIDDPMKIISQNTLITIPRMQNVLPTDDRPEVHEHYALLVSIGKKRFYFLRILKA